MSALPLDILKLHQLQIIRGTQLAEEYARQPFKLYTADEYIDLVTAYIEHIREDIVLERFVSQSPADLLIAPKWGLKNHEFTNLLVNHMRAVGAYQGKKLLQKETRKTLKTRFAQELSESKSRDK